MTIMRNLAAIILAMLAGGTVVAIIEFVNSVVYPMPEGVSRDDVEALKAWIQSLPVVAKLVVCMAWLCGGLVGTAVARLVAKRRVAWPALVFLALFFIAILLNLVSIPHPVWMWFLGPLAGLLGGLIGIILVSPPLRVEQERIIQAPLAKVFETISTAEGFSAAVPGILKIEFLTEKKQGVGTRFRETRVMHGKEASSVMEIAEFQPNKMVRMVADEGGSVWDSVFQVTDIGNGTRLRLVMDARPHKLLAKLMTPMIMPMISNAIGQDMDAVKSYCEQDSANAKSGASNV